MSCIRISIKPYLFLFILIDLITQSCKSKKSDSTTLTSEDFSSKTERIDVLRKEIKIFSELKDAEFYLINANGFSNQRVSVPGASSLDYQFAIKIDTNDINMWLEGMTETPGHITNNYWIDKIPVSRKENWETHSTPKVFTRIGNSVTMFVYKDEGIIFKHIWSN